MRTKILPALLAAGAAALTLAVAAPADAASARTDAGTAQAAAAPAAPDFTCPSRSVCLFPGLNGTGNYPIGSPVVVPTDGNSGTWWSFSFWGASNPNPGSLHDNSGSAVFVYDKQHDRIACIDAGQRVNLSNEYGTHEYGYFDIDFGVGNCADASYPLPLP